MTDTALTPENIEAIARALASDKFDEHGWSCRHQALNSIMELRKLEHERHKIDADLESKRITGDDTDQRLENLEVGIRGVMTEVDKLTARHDAEMKDVTKRCIDYHKIVLDRLGELRSEVVPMAESAGIGVRNQWQKINTHDAAIAELRELSTYKIDQSEIDALQFQINALRTAPRHDAELAELRRGLEYEASRTTQLANAIEHVVQDASDYDDDPAHRDDDETDFEQVGRLSPHQSIPVTITQDQPARDDAAQDEVTKWKILGLVVQHNRIIGIGSDKTARDVITKAIELGLVTALGGEDGDVVVFGDPISRRRVTAKVVSRREGEPMLFADDFDEPEGEDVPTARQLRRLINEALDTGGYFREMRPDSNTANKIGKRISRHDELFRVILEHLGVDVEAAKEPVSRIVLPSLVAEQLSAADAEGEVASE